ncbi:MAG: alpha/beta hydrolase [Deferrisomatales bacterium]
MSGARLVGWLAVGAAAYLGLVALAWLFQRRLIYLPMGAVPAARSVLPAAREVTFTTDDGLTLGGWFVPAEGPPLAAAVVLNGNAGNRAYRAPLAAALARRGVATLLFDYRGYGGNPGRPSEAGLLADARAARAFLASLPGVDPARIVLFGESLGAAVAVASAAEHPPAALVLRSPFTSLVDLGRHHYPFLPVTWLLADRYPSRERIRSLICPLLVIAGERDRVVPASQSRALFEAAPAGAKRFLAVPGADHNDPALFASPPLVAAVAEFVGAAVGPPDRP